MIRTSFLLALTAALLPGVALADDDRNGDRDKRKGEGGPPATLTAPAQSGQTIYIVKGTIKSLALPGSITVSVNMANAAGAQALGAQAGPLAGPVDQVVKIDPLTTKVFRSSRGDKKDDARSKSRKGNRGGPAAPVVLQVGDEVKVKWRGAAGLNGAGLAAIAAEQIIAKSPPLVKFKVKAIVMALPASGAPLPVTVLVDPFKVNGNAAQALAQTTNPPTPNPTGGTYDAAGTIPVIIDAFTKVKVKVKGKGHWGHHRTGKKNAWKLSRVKVGDRVEVEWKAPAGSRFWEVPAREVEFKASKNGWQIVG